MPGAQIPPSCRCSSSQQVANNFEASPYVNHWLVRASVLGHFAAMEAIMHAPSSALRPSPLGMSNMAAIKLIAPGC